MSILGSIGNFTGATALRTVGTLTPRIGGLADFRDDAFGAANNITDPGVNYVGVENADYWNQPSPTQAGYTRAGDLLPGGQSVGGGVGNTLNAAVGSGGIGGGGAAGGGVDARYAPWGGQVNYDNLINQFNTQKSGIQSSALDAGAATAGQYGRSILDFLDSNRLGQGQIDRQAANNELAKMQGTQGVLGMVGRGIRSSGVQLGNRNAGSSSAAGALANAYGELGRGELSKVGNQYEQGNQAVADAQNQFQVQQASGIRNLQGSKEENVNKIVNEARNAFASLDAQMAQASLPERIAIEQEKESIRQQILGKLQVFDQQLTSGVAGIAPTSVDQRRTSAAELARAGTDLGSDAFQYSTDVPAQFQGTGPFSSELPLFTMPRRRIA
jgi:hypothetical protein